MQLPRCESETVEFKAKLSGLEREIVAFANARGGTIYIGVDDQGQACPVDLNNRMRSQIISAINNCDPRPDFRIEESSGVVALQIPEGNNKPYRTSGGFYLRMGATSQKLSRDAIINVYIDNNRLQFDSQVIASVTDLDNTPYFSRATFHRFREIAALPQQIGDLDLLENLNLVKIEEGNTSITHALVLLFSQTPERWFPHCRTVLWRMASPTEIVDQRLVSGNLFEQMNAAFAYLKEHLATAYAIQKLKRDELPEFPDFVLRELVVNALVHRDYFERGAEVQVKLFPKSVEFSNPGSPLYDLDPNELLGRSLRRNPIIAEVFQRAGYIERAGTGLLRINDQLERQGSPRLRLSREARFFVAELTRSQSASTHSSGFPTDRADEILSHLKQHGLVTTQQLSDLFGVSRRQIRNDLARLVQQNKVKRQRRGRRFVYRLS
ncbi:MAG: putative DNA binding domain-containing protein [Deltaproteobacteria bacterium]|nr:putative DNA binding domain-containing protein [Deltaproteobacteria bacterium]